MLSLTLEHSMSISSPAVRGLTPMAYVVPLSVAFVPGGVVRVWPCPSVVPPCSNKVVVLVVLCAFLCAFRQKEDSAFSKI